MEVFKQSRFSRLLSNDAKMGAYYTNLSMCERIGNLFCFPQGEDVSILEPSCGDLTALRTVLNAAGMEEEKGKIFGVELNPETYQEVKDQCFACLNVDFLNGVKISHASFGFCFANPPYGQDEHGIRLEQKFAEKVWAYLKKGCPIAFVIPYYTLREEAFFKSFLARYELRQVYRFDDAVYKQFQQVVLVATKRGGIGVLRSKADMWRERINSVEQIPYLPKEPVENPLMAIPSKEQEIEYFTSLEFHPEEAAKNLYRSALKFKLDDYAIPKFSGGMVGQPPVPLKKDLLYLLAVSGGGQGMVGSVENRDVHLQRGVAKVVNRVQYSMETKSLKETSATEVVLTIIENDGSIKELS